MKPLHEKLGFFGKGPLLDRVRSLRARRKNVYDRLKKISEQRDVQKMNLSDIKKYVETRRRGHKTDG